MLSTVVDFYFQVRLTLEKVRKKMYGEYDEMKRKIQELTKELAVSICVLSKRWQHYYEVAALLTYWRVLSLGDTEEHNSDHEPKVLCRGCPAMSLTKAFASSSRLQNEAIWQRWPYRLTIPPSCFCLNFLVMELEEYMVAAAIIFLTALLSGTLLGRR